MKRTVYYNGTILTMDESLQASVVVVEDGKIVRVDDSNVEKMQAKDKGDTRFVNLKGAVLMPSFIDPHSHFSGYAMAQKQVPLDGAESFDDIVEGIRAFIRENQVPAGTWVFAKGYDHNRLKEHAHPTAEVLDRVGSDHPIILKHQSGHMGVFNTIAINMFGVTADTPSPSGGIIGVENGKVTGYMEENAFIAYQQYVPTPSVEEIADACVAVQKKYASYGITTVQEGMLPSRLVPVYQRLAEKQMLTLDVVGFVDAEEADPIMGALSGHRLAYQDHFKVGGIKIFLDGSPQGRTAWMRKPYEGEGNYHGYPVLNDEQVEERVRYAARNHVQVLAHCNGDAAAAQYLRACRKITEEGYDLKGIRPVLVHGQLLGLDQLREVKELGVMPSFFAAHVYHWGDTHLQNFGYERACHISPAASALKLGIPFTFHQDCPVLDPKMLETVWCSVKRQTRGGITLEEEAISVLEGLKAITKWGAYQYFEEDSKGTIAPGKRADLVILDRNPLTVPVDELREIRVLETIKDGETVYENR